MPGRSGTELKALLANAASAAEGEGNCMLQLSLMLAQIALEPVDEAYREAASQQMLSIMRAKPTSNVVAFMRVTPSMRM